MSNDPKVKTLTLNKGFKTIGEKRMVYWSIKINNMGLQIISSYFCPIHCMMIIYISKKKKFVKFRVWRVVRFSTASIAIVTARLGGKRSQLGEER
jgi:hypothetical protein